MKCLAITIGVVLWFTPADSTAAELTLKVVDKEPPGEIAASIKKSLQSKAVQLLDRDKAAFEFWFSSELPLQSKPASIAKALDNIKQTTLLGVVAIQGSHRDYKDNDLPSGVYTMRFALQPQDGDHLGTAEFPYFAVLVPSTKDASLDGIATYNALVKTSGKGTSTGHPMIISLRPASSEDGDSPKLNEPISDHKSVRVKVPAKSSDQGEKTSVIFELVYQGKGKV